MAAAFSDMIVDSGIRGYNGPDGGSPPRSKTPESSMTFTKFVSKGTDSGVNQGWRSSWLRNVVFEPEFQRWLGQQIESCPVDPRDTRRHRYIEFSSMPPANLHNFGSMTRQHLSPELFAKIKDVRTSSGYSISNAIQAGLLNPHDKIGLVLGDEESFDAFADVLTPIIEGYHSIDSLEYEFESNLNAEDLVFTQEQAAKFDEFVLWTCISAPRNIAGYPLPPAMHQDERFEVEDVMSQVFASFPSSLDGEYCPLSNLTTGPTEPNDQDQSHGGGWQEWLEAISQLRGGALKQTTALKQVPGPLGMLSASGAARFWPEGSGIFHDSGYNSICLVNLEDHCRLAVSVQGGNVTRALQDFAHLNEEAGSALRKMNYGLMFDLRYGFLSSCPSNLGTGLVVSVGIKLPRLSGRPDMLRDICDEYGLESHPAKYDSGVSDGTPVLIITTRRNMACTEVQLAQRIVDGVASLIKVEDQLTGGRSDAATLGARAVPQVAPLTIPLPPKSPGIWGLNPSTDLHEGGGAESSGVATPVWVNSSSSSQAGGGGEENSATHLMHGDAKIATTQPTSSPQPEGNFEGLAGIPASNDGNEDDDDDMQAMLREPSPHASSLAGQPGLPPTGLGGIQTARNFEDDFKVLEGDGNEPKPHGNEPAAPTSMCMLADAIEPVTAVERAMQAEASMRLDLDGSEGGVGADDDAMSDEPLAGEGELPPRKHKAPDKYTPAPQDDAPRQKKMRVKKSKTAAAKVKDKATKVDKTVVLKKKSGPANKAAKTVTRSHHKAKSPANESPAEAKSPTKVSHHKAKSPIKLSPAEAKSPTKVSHHKAKSPIKLSPAEAKSPTKVSHHKAKSPIKLSPAEAKSPTKRPLFEAKTPPQGSPSKAKSPTTTLSPIKKKPTATVKATRSKAAKSRIPHPSARPYKSAMVMRSRDPSQAQTRSSDAVERKVAFSQGELDDAIGSSPQHKQVGMSATQATARRGLFPVRMLQAPEMHMTEEEDRKAAKSAKRKASYVAKKLPAVRKAAAKSGKAVANKAPQKKAPARKVKPAPKPANRAIKVKAPIHKAASLNKSPQKKPSPAMAPPQAAPVLKALDTVVGKAASPPKRASGAFTTPVKHASGAFASPPKGSSPKHTKAPPKTVKKKTGGNSKKSTTVSAMSIKAALIKAAGGKHKLVST